MLTIAQKFSQVGLHMSVAFAVAYAATGSLATGGLAALVEPVCNVLLLPWHDRAWRHARRWLLRRRLAGRRETIPETTPAAA